MHVVLKIRGWIVKHIRINRLMRDQAMHLFACAAAPVEHRRQRR